MIQNIKNNKCLFLRKCVPPLYYDAASKTFHKGINQLLLAENNFTGATCKLHDFIKNPDFICSDKKTILICSLNEKKEFNFYLNIKSNRKTYKSIETFSFNNTLEDYFKYYFFCAFTQKQFNPEYFEINKTSLINFIEKNPRNFSININQLFNEIEKGTIL